MKKVLKRIGITLLTLILIFVAYFFTIRHFDNNVLENKDENPPSIGQLDSPIRIPSHFIDSARFYVKMGIVGGDTILGFCDTGGGMSMLMPKYKDNAAIKPLIKSSIFKGLMPMNYILFNDLVTDANFPNPVPLRGRVLRNPFSRITNPYLLVPPMDKELEMGMKVQPELGAFLGQDFFMFKSWTMDYLGQEIWLNTPLNQAELGQANVQKIGFKKNEHGEKIFGHPSMRIEVDGEIIDVLFDTGATSILTDEGRTLLETDKKSLGSSFIAASIFDAWREKHPDWKYYPKAEWLGDIIEVPLIKIGEYEVGPVLFSKRPDENWSNGMIASMDKVVKGAIGGSGLKYFKVTIDYNTELIRFER
jgi:hypothetical protein